MTTVAEALATARHRLAASDSSALDAELLLGAVLGLPRARLIAEDRRTLDPGDLERFEALIARRAAGEPVAYLTGRRGFWTLELEVTPAVLVPRPETELLVELALARLPQGHCRVLDLGTGSGAVALAIAAERPEAQVDAVDESAAAVALARHNARRSSVGNVRFGIGHWFAPVAGRRYHLVVANPPYLAADDPHLPALAHEPHGALVAGLTGLEALEEIAEATPLHLLPGGWLIAEHGEAQGAAVRRLWQQSGLAEVETARDLAGLDRATIGRLPGTPGPAAG
ncbi:MAG: peptide chain release factor N(5)-glutamine methyltransferase [Steroidobacteraceae bacterium]|jgi:release factor glutamine methyltransferase|nr:peptide chain release factor N(5)-glutamine methyltransferase [Steroidobacteraceae bacterium]